MIVIGIEVSGRGVHHDAMRAMRDMTLLLMLVAFLPWQAYAAAYAARSAQALPDAVVLAASDHHATNPAPRPAIAVAPKKCRIATLPGFSCAPDPAIHPTQAGDPSACRGSVIRHAGNWVADSAATEPPTGPPRSI